MLRDHLEYARAHCVRWFVAVDPNHAAVACPCGVPERRVVGCRTLDELRDQCFVGRAAVEVSIDCEPAASATVVTARTAATRSWYRRCRIRVAPPTSLRPNPYRTRRSTER